MRSILVTRMTSTRPALISETVRWNSGRSRFFPERPSSRYVSNSSQKPEYLFRDNDGICGNGVPLFLKNCGIEEVRTAYRSPWQTPFVERFIGTLRRELLDHVIVLNQGHLEHLLREFIEYYHTARPHQGIGGNTPIAQEKPPRISAGPSKLVSIRVLGGLHHRHVRVAA